LILSASSSFYFSSFIFCLEFFACGSVHLFFSLCFIFSTTLFFLFVSGGSALVMLLYPRLHRRLLAFLFFYFFFLGTRVAEDRCLGSPLVLSLVQIPALFVLSLPLQAFSQPDK
jgi:hypothetical protein